MEIVPHSTHSFVPQEFGPQGGGQAGQLCQSKCFGELWLTQVGIDQESSVSHEPQAYCKICRDSRFPFVYLRTGERQFLTARLPNIEALEVGAQTPKALRCSNLGYSYGTLLLLWEQDEALLPAAGRHLRNSAQQREPDALLGLFNQFDRVVEILHTER